jgi:hypothetical protein
MNKPKVSPTCEVIEGRAMCGKPTTHAYPAWKGAWMALCKHHAKPHLPNACWPLEQLRKEGKIS